MLTARIATPAPVLLELLKLTAVIESPAAPERSIVPTVRLRLLLGRPLSTAAQPAKVPPNQSLPVTVPKTVPPLWSEKATSKLPPPSLIWNRTLPSALEPIRIGVARVVSWGPLWSTSRSQLGWIPTSLPLAVASNAQLPPVTVLRFPRWTMSSSPAWSWSTNGSLIELDGTPPVKSSERSDMARKPSGSSGTSRSPAWTIPLKL